MTEAIITLVLPMAFAAAALWGSVFYEKDGWRAWSRFAVLLLGMGEDIFVDKYGNEYISTGSQSAYGGQWNVTKTYRIKGQNGRTFCRKLRWCGYSI